MGSFRIVFRGDGDVSLPATSSRIRRLLGVSGAMRKPTGRVELETAEAVLPFVRTPVGGGCFRFGGIVHGVGVKGRAYGCWETRCCGGRDGLAASI